MTECLWWQGLGQMPTGRSMRPAEVEAEVAGQSAGPALVIIQSTPSQTVYVG